MKNYISRYKILLYRYYYVFWLLINYRSSASRKYPQYEISIAARTIYLNHFHSMVLGKL